MLDRKNKSHPLVLGSWVFGEAKRVNLPSQPKTHFLKDVSEAKTIHKRSLLQHFFNTDFNTLNMPAVDNFNTEDK